MANDTGPGDLPKEHQDLTQIIYMPLAVLIANPISRVYGLEGGKRGYGAGAVPL